ncbi:MAG: CvpA family protein [Gammaproteobacteria bacterium]|nr:CvpA family protein [Gammaproteobacteria bacterium]
MNALDLAILGILLLSALISFVRGFTKEVFSLAAWVLAIWVAVTYTGLGTLFLESYISHPSLRVGVAFIVLFLVTLILATLLNVLLSSLVKKTGLSGTDRMVGLIFGVARGAVIVSVLVLLAGITELPKERWWQESRLLSHFEQMASWLREYLPPDAAAGIVYN